MHLPAAFFVLVVVCFHEALGFVSTISARKPHQRAVVPLRDDGASAAAAATAAVGAASGPPGATKRALRSTSASAAPADAHDPNAAPSGREVHVVLFGPGDLRVDDHIGLLRALSAAGGASNSNGAAGGDPRIVPLCLLSGRMLSNLPGAVAHTVDTARILRSALVGLDDQLEDALGWRLNVLLLDEGGGGGEETLEECLTRRVAAQVGADRLTVHACDLGPADNRMGYGAFSQICHIQGGGRIQVCSWNNNLRTAPWESVDRLPDRFPSYESAYCRRSTPAVPASIHASGRTTSQQGEGATMVRLGSCHELPSAEDLQQLLIRHAGLDPDRCRAEQNTGLYATHWGGLPPESVGEAAVIKTIQAYASCGENDRKWFEHPAYVGRKVKRNGLSLEHAAMQWQLEGDGRHPVGDADNWLPGESLARYLAAPLLLGTVSPRRIWHMPRSEGLLCPSPLKRLVEAREWHRLLAARNMRSDPAYRGQGATTYKYWRYQGFLVRYAETDLASAKEAGSTGTNDGREGVLLVHGFGASGAQWNKAMQSFSSVCSDRTCQGLAPDLLGFGQSEKPSISYTAYLWDSMASEFVKEVALPKNGWTSFIVGGNSIGGFTSMSMAASDTAVVGGRQVTSSGSPGTGRCTGLVLMNSAGPLKSRQEVEESLESAIDLQRLSVAQVTALSGLPPCKPPPRPVARAFGNALLAYLRPNIQSICKNLYPTNPASVDEVLCDDIARDSLDPGAIFVMMAGAKLPAPRTANELLQADYGCPPPYTSPDQVRESTFPGPVLIAQGVLDPLNDAAGRMKGFGALRNGITTDPISAGHCPHDELPKEVALSMAKWMSATLRERTEMLSAPSVAASR